MKINEVARKSGVTVRTLHYYHKIGLLSPSAISMSGYRLYDDEALDRLRQILFFKELDFSLKEIKKIMHSPRYDKAEALRTQKELLMKKRSRLDGLIDLLDKSIKGEKEMSLKQFDRTEIEEAKKKYAKEVEERWGDTSAYVESQKKTSGYSPEQWKKINGEAGSIYEGFAKIRNESPEREDAQALVKEWRDHLTRYYYECTDEILAGLGVMYTQDERFRKNIDKYGEGTAAFMSSAIEVFRAK